MRSAAIAVLVVCGIGLGAFMGHRRTPPTTYQVRVDTLVRESARLDTVYRTRKVRYDSIMAKYDTVRMTDTVMVNDTVYIPRAVADSAITACRLVVTTCEAQKANLTARLAIAESSLTAKSKRSPLTAIKWAVIGAIIGLAIQ
jgi:hypothetical protein